MLMASAKRLSSGKLEKMDFEHNGGDFEESLAVAKSSKADKIFDTVIGHIEDIIMEKEFQKLQNDFMETHYQMFEDIEENKLVYTEIHNKYTRLIETFLESELLRRMPGFCMEEFQKQLVSRRKELDGEVFEILLTFSDFLSFKESVLDFKAAKEGGCRGLDDGLRIFQLKDPPICTVNAASNYQPCLAKPNGTAGLESGPLGFSDRKNEEICLPVQNMSLGDDLDFGLCIVGSGFKSSEK